MAPAMHSFTIQQEYVDALLPIHLTANAAPSVEVESVPQPPTPPTPPTP